MIQDWLIPKPLRLPRKPERIFLLELEGILSQNDPVAHRAIQERPASASPPETTRPSGLEPKTLSDLATHLWRMRKDLIDPGTGAPQVGMRKVCRHYEAAIDSLKQGGLQIIDHTGDPFDAGLSLQVLTYQPTADVDRDRIIETVRPTIYLRDDRIQMGVVIVGTPLEKS